jgi:hypothetical protein
MLVVVACLPFGGSNEVITPSALPQTVPCSFYIGVEPVMVPSWLILSLFGADNDSPASIARPDSGKVTIVPGE